MSRRNSAPRGGVPFLPEIHIEREAELLLSEYGERFEEIVEPPVPIDEIIELHLQLTFEITDLRDLFGVGDIHGAIWLKDGRIAVDKSLDPAVNPRKLGRYRFTLAHETGHWRLHRIHYLDNPDQPGLFDHEGKPSIICRSSDTQPVEWQANAFAAFLLMPREMVFAAWETWRGDLIPLYLTDVRAWFDSRGHSLRGQLISRAADRGSENALDEILMEYKIKPLADKFQVSTQAMRIRLENLKLLQPKKERTLFD